MSRKSAADIVVKDKPREWGRGQYGPEFVTEIMRHPGNGKHHTRDLDVAKGKSRKPKYKPDYSKEAALSYTASLDAVFLDLLYR